jgi:hypothetical protein
MSPDRFEAALNASQPDRIEASIETSGSSAIRAIEIRLSPERVADREFSSGDGASVIKSQSSLRGAALQGGIAAPQVAAETPSRPLYHLHSALLI